MHRNSIPAWDTRTDDARALAFLQKDLADAQSSVSDILSRLYVAKLAKTHAIFSQRVVSFLYAVMFVASVGVAVYFSVQVNNEQGSNNSVG